jgi:hypothetical protein
MQRIIIPSVVFGIGVALLAASVQINSSCPTVVTTTPVYGAATEPIPLVPSSGPSMLMRVTTKIVIILGVSMMVLAIGFVLCDRKCKVENILSPKIMYAMVGIIGAILVASGVIMIMESKECSSTWIFWFIITIGAISMLGGGFMFFIGLDNSLLEALEDARDDALYNQISDEIDAESAAATENTRWLQMSRASRLYARGKNAASGVYNYVFAPTSVVPSEKNITIPANFTLPSAIVLPSGTRIQAGTSFAQDRTIPTNSLMPTELRSALSGSIVIPAGTVFPKGIVLPNGTKLPSGGSSSKDEVLPLGSLVPSSVRSALAAESIRRSRDRSRERSNDRSSTTISSSRTLVAGTPAPATYRLADGSIIRKGASFNRDILLPSSSRL